MTALDLWHECRRKAVALSVTVEGKLHYEGAVASTLLSTMKDNRDALIECVAALDGALFGDGPYLPWGPYTNADLLKQWQRELFEAVDELARLEGWPDDHFDLLVGAIDRQPVSTLRPDLAHFQARLDKARAAAAAGRHHESR